MVTQRLAFSGAIGRDTFRGRGGSLYAHACAHTRRENPGGAQRLEGAKIVMAEVMALRTLSLSARSLRALRYHRWKHTTAVTGGPAMDKQRPQPRYDVVIVGGGVMGSSSAYFLASRTRKSVCVIERDLSVSP